MEKILADELSELLANYMKLRAAESEAHEAHEKARSEAHIASISFTGALRQALRIEQA